ncbi:MAG: hypothetical protein CBD60_02315 [Flavobacteriaceae bacterium TMED200]|nr:hypothetical protein [Flavobacteriaceae bacterium]OUW66012.1 MAG: hypothetical protein CBD60_02315 [Flavobacteriaceae bacterium TMED200]|tara:strand:- start:526 stop:750 length:225 start_codon:yes stop_codon:yes gene_type:complete
MRIFLNVLFWSLTSFLVYGLYLKEKGTSDISEVLIGFSVFALSFLYLPFFLYHRYKGKDLSKYTFDFKKLRKKE